jgi:hypothetical protein
LDSLAAERSGADEGDYERGDSPDEDMASIIAGGAREQEIIKLDPEADIDDALDQLLEDR